MDSEGKQDTVLAVDDSWHNVSFTARTERKSSVHLDAGALIVLESKGDWWHAGFHLSSAIAGAPLLSLPFALVLLGWYGGVIVLVVCGVVSMYGYQLFSEVVDRADAEGHRRIRYRETAQYVLGNSWAYYIVATFQLALCFISVAALSLFAATFLKATYILWHPDGNFQLYEFTIMFGILAMILAQLPSFHSIRYINFVATLLMLTISAIAAGGSVYVGHSSRPPEKDYSIPQKGSSRMFGVFLAISVICTLYGNAVMPEIQATIAPPVAGKMVEGLIFAYSVIWSTYLSVGIAGYWAFGNSVYMQPCFEIIEGKSADAAKGSFSKRNVLPRLVLRSLFIAMTTLVAAMFPFIGDFLAIVGAFGFIPLDYVFPFIFHIMVFKPSHRSLQYWLHVILAVLFSLLAI